MNHEFRLADIGEGLEEAEIITWLVNVGDQVSRDQPLVEVMTDKSNAELPAPVAGTIVGLAGDIGDIISVGGLIAVIAEGSDASDLGNEPLDVIDHTVSASGPPALAPDANAPLPDAASPSPTRRPKASPSTRRLAAERGIDLHTVVGSGPGGRILSSDLDQSVPASASATVGTPPSTQTSPASAVPVARRDPVTTPVPRVPEPVAPSTPQRVAQSAEPGSTTALRGVRRAVAKNMAQSWSEIPHIHAFDHIDAEPLLKMRRRLKETERTGYERLTPLTFFVAAVARALRTHPQANASIDMTAETIVHHAEVNVGIAVASPQGLVVPVVHGADQMSFEALAHALNELVQGARAASLSREQFRGGTVTITNFGSLGGEQAVPIIRPPESMIFGFGSIKERPFVIDGQVVARKTMNLVAGADHRLLDGDVTTSVLTDVATSLTDPLRLVI